MREVWLELKSLALDPRFAKIISNIVIGFVIIAGVYFIMLESLYSLSGDEAVQIINTTAAKRPVGELFFNSQASQSRFWPLGLAYYNILTLLPYGYTSRAHFMLNALIFVLLILLVVNILNFSLQQNLLYLYIKTFLVFCFPFIVISWRTFFALDFAETFLCFLFALFVLCYKKMMLLSEDQTDRHALNTFINNSLNSKFFKWLKYLKNIFSLEQQKIYWAVLAVFVAIFATYCKEPTFAVFLTIACVNLLFLRNPLRKLDKIFNFVLIANAVCFGISYLLIIIPKAAFVYGDADKKLQISSFLNNIDIIFYRNPLLILLIIFIAMRLYFVLFKKDRKHIFYDGLLFSSFAYCAILMVLHLYDNHYFSPPFVLFFIALAYWCINFYNKKKYIILALLFISIGFLSVNGFSSIKRIFISPYEIKRILTYSFIKIDMLSSDKQFYYIDYNRDVDSKQYWFFRNAIEYVNSIFFEIQILDESRVGNDNYARFVKHFLSDEAIDKDAIYVLNNIDILGDFVKIANWDSHSVFIYKEKFAKI
jgi:hypothetical protein